MTPALSRARSGLALVLALALGGSAAMAPCAALAKDEEGRRLTLDEVERGQQAKSAALLAEARVKRLEAIDRLKELLGRAPEDDRKAEMMLRLSDLYFEEGRALYFAEMEGFQKAYDECFNTSENADACDKMAPDNRESFSWYGKAIKLYEAILRGYPRYQGADRATFYLGMTHQEMRNKDKALESFKKLVKLYPQSNFVADAYVLIGEYYFDNNEAFAALQAYKRAAAYKDSPRYPYAMYKLAWSYYNVESYGEAIDTMKAVVAYSTATDTAGQGGIKLEEEALKDLVRFFADAGELDEAYAYFTGLGRKDLIPVMLKRLAGLYFEQGKFEQSIETYRRLIAEAPSSPENPAHQEEIIAAYRRMGQRDRVLDEIRRLRNDYGRSSAWWRANASDPKAQTTADETIEKALRRTATDFNKEARELKKSRHPRANEAFTAAVDAYYVYLEDYTKHGNAYNVHYDFGEMLYMLGRFDEAFREYMTVVDMNPNGEHSRFCAESAIFAAEEMVKKEGGAELKIKENKGIDKNVQPVPLTEWEQKLIAACKRYADLYPGDAKVEEATYKSAFLLYNRFHFTEAAEQFRSVISRWPTSKNAEFSANLILDALLIREEWVALRDTSKVFYEQEKLGGKSFKKEMYDIYSGASFTVIEKNHEAKQDFAATADAFVAFYKEFPDFEKVDVALNNAAAYYYKVNRVADAMEVRHILVEDPKFAGKTRFYYSQVANLGFDYERLADFANAVKYYDLLFSLYPKEREKTADDAKADLDAQAADALYSAAVFSNALGDWQAAIGRYDTFVKSFPADERVPDVRLTVGRIYEDHDDLANAATRFEAFYAKDVKDAPPELAYFARLHQGRALLGQGKTSDARKLYKSTVDLYASQVKKGLEPGAHTEFVAEMMVELAQPEAEAYAELKIKGAGTKNQRQEDKAFKASLEAKAKALKKLTDTYTAIIQTGAGEWGLAALVGLGKAYENMASTLTSSPCPFYLTEDQCDIYTMTLQDRAYVQNEKAVEAYKLALDKSYELNLYNDNAAFATRRLGELRPDDYPGLFETIPEPGLTSDSVKTFEVETSLR
ncbi:MAG: tetratricopeptide repeat protein [Alphaproteobacteria bacterium]|nr:tetratricopeptide repeat protein [Alphaproteobacteria bacterium]